MGDVLGVDAGVAAPFVITAPLPDSVVDRAKTAKRLSEREEWRIRQRDGKTAENKRPPGVSFWAANGWIAVPALFVGGALAFLVQLAAKGLGALFGFSPGLTWLWVLVIGSAVSGLVLLVREEDARDRAVKELEAAQHTFTAPEDRALIAGGHRSALAMIDLWARLPLNEELDISRLRKKLCELAGALANRRKLEDTVANLRTATVGVPKGSSAARDLEANIAHLDSMYQAADAEARRHTGDLAKLARLCRSLYDERQAISRAQQASRQAEAVLGTVSTVVRPIAEDTDSTTRQVAVILDAYRELDQNSDKNSAA